MTSAQARLRQNVRGLQGLLHSYHTRRYQRRPRPQRSDPGKAEGLMPPTKDAAFLRKPEERRLAAAKGLPADRGVLSEGTRSVIPRGMRATSEHLTCRALIARREAGVAPRDA